MFLFVALLIVGFVVLAKYRPVWAFYASIALAPWQELMVDLGLRVTLYTVSLFGVFYAAFSSGGIKNVGNIFNRKWIYMCAFFVWATLDTLVNLQYTSVFVVTGGWLRSPTIRPFLQIISLLIMMAPVICAPFVIRQKDDLLRAVNIFLASVTVLIILGWWQLMSIKYFSMDPFPMGFINGWLGGVGVVRSGLDSGPNHTIIYRMSSLGGEPRYLAQSAAAALLLIQVFYQERVVNNKIIFFLIYLNLFAGLMATMAVSGIYLWVIGFIGFLVYYLRSQHDGLVNANSKWILIVLISFAATVWCASLLAEFEWGYLFSRIMRRGLIADFDRVVLDFLMAEPKWILFGVGLGNVHLHADPYLQPYLRDFAGGTSFVADSGWLRLLSETGIVGLFLFLIFMMTLYSYLNENIKTLDKFYNTKLLKCIFFIGAFGYLARGNTFAPIAFLLIGLSIAPIFWDSVQDRAHFDV